MVETEVRETWKKFLEELYKNDTEEQATADMWNFDCAIRIITLREIW